MLRTRRTAALAATATAALAAGGVLAAVAPAQAATPLPPHVFAPFVEMWTGDSPATLAQQSGATYQTWAFLQAATKGSCDVYWSGDTSLPVATSSFGSDLTKIRALGGDVIPSFGGYTADNTGTELADSCTSVDAIAATFEKVVTTYDVTRIDLDVEDNSLTNTAGITRRNQAIKKVQDWAAANGRTVQFQYTLPTTTSGLASSGLAVLKNAVANGARIDSVNLMTFDYYDGQTHRMADDTKSAITGLVAQLRALYPTKSDAELWGMAGITEMPGIDDYGAAETFTTADAQAVASWASAQGVGFLSFWALQRDNGGCVGQGGSDSCSGISQSTWQFTQTFQGFTSGTTTPTTPPTTPPTPTDPPTSPGTCTAAAWSSSAVYTGGQLVSSGGHTWKAQWWTQGEKPGTADVWADQGACGGTTTTGPTTSPTTPTAPGACTVAAWSSQVAYSGGATVSYGGHRWTATWWTQGDVPGANSQNVWSDGGTC